MINHDTESAYVQYFLIGDIVNTEDAVDYYEFSGMTKKEIKKWIDETAYDY